MAIGSQALRNNFGGLRNVAVGYRALFSNTGDGVFGGGASNTAVGDEALLNNNSNNNPAIAYNNTAIGQAALVNNTTGSSNIALGTGAGEALTTGDNNIDIGNEGVAAESNTIRIGGGTAFGPQTATFIAGISGASVTGSPVLVASNGQLGTAPSSARFKDAIKPMDKASEAILALKPVTFHYKKALDPEGVPQFGLVAEDVEKVNPNLVVRDNQGKVYTVRYEAVNAMLLNEFLKEHRKNEEQEKTIAELKSGMTALAATVKEQASQIQKVNAQLEASKPAPQVVSSNQ